MPPACSLVSTPPVGLQGELMTRIFVLGVTAFSKSSAVGKNPFSSLDGTGTTTPPLFSTCWKYAVKQGSAITTSSPGLSIAWKQRWAA